ncbi:MAG: hypothetical protein ACFFD2_01925 [Promethearchaeota archaeon]
MLSNSNNEHTEKIIRFNEVVEKLENISTNLIEDFNTDRIDKDEFESKKINLLEEIKKTKYEIYQFKETLSVRNEHEKVILKELHLLFERFQTEIDEDTGIATIYLSASLDTHFNIDVDCSKYPYPPYIFIPKDLDDFFDRDIVLELKTLKKWSIKKPPHLVDIFEELEEKLVEVFLKDDEIIDDREKIANRRKLIESARIAENSGNFKKALRLYQNVLSISQGLKDKRTYIKYKEKIKEVKQNL